MINEVTLAKSPVTVRLYVRMLRLTFWALQRMSRNLASLLALRIFLTPPPTKTSRWERSFEQQGTQDFVELDGKRLRVLFHGTGAGTVLLVHGWGSRGTHLGSYAESLAKAGYRVCTMDGPAHGQSTGSGTDMIEFAQAIARVARHVGGVDVIVGHSFGAACTLLAIERFGLRTGKLVLISCFADAVFITESFARFFRIGQSVIRAMRHRVEHRYGNQWTWEQLAPARLIKAYSRPVLVIHDESDVEVPFEHARALCKNHGNARLVSTQGQGHRKILRDKKAIAATVAFLKNAA